MKTILIIRHAKSGHDNYDLKDIDRPLAERGFSDAAIMGKWLQTKGMLPGIILTSPALRARTTCDIIAKAVNFDTADVLVESELYFGDVPNIINIVRSCDNGMDIAFLFGHNPTFSILSHTLCPDFDADMPTTGIVAMQFITDDWKAVRSGDGHLLWFEYPKKYR